MPLEKLIAYFNNYLPLNEEEQQQLTSRVTVRPVKRRAFILQENDVCRHYTFVVSGSFKKYYVDLKGNEHNLLFAIENDWIMEIDSFYSERPARVYIEAIEPSVIIQINKEDLLFLFVNNPKFDRNFRVIVETRLAELENRLLLFLSASAEERYLTFMKQHPKLMERLPGTQIASFLGLTPEFLSKLRKDISFKRV